jgi:anti-sigma factor RsiW
MNCASIEPLLEAALDGELDLNRQSEMREHLENCASCSAFYVRLQQLREDIGSASLYHHAPDSLKRRVLTSVREASNSSVARAEWPWKWIALAASVLLIFSISANLFLSKRDIPETQLIAQLIAQEVMSQHVRSMLTNRQVDVISSDRHSVKPWFGNKLDFSPDVKDLAAQGFPLIGGRVDYINRRPVAALVFQRSKHIINLFTWPASSAITAVRSQDGYHVVAWTKDGMTYWAVSDLNPDELEQFSRLYKR